MTANPFGGTARTPSASITLDRRCVPTSRRTTDSRTGQPPRVSCRLSTTGIRLLGNPVPAEDFHPPHGRPTRRVPKHPPGPRRGFHVPHTRITTGLGALFTPRPRGAQPTGPIPPAVARPLFQGPGPIAPVHIPSPRSCLLRGVVKGSLAFTRPAFSPARSSLDGTRTALGTLPGLRTPQTRSLQRTPRRETGIEHSPGATARPTSPHLLTSGIFPISQRGVLRCYQPTPTISCAMAAIRVWAAETMPWRFLWASS